MSRSELTPPLFLRGRELRPTPARPLVMGIVNASPESFSNGHEVGSTEDQIARALAMHDDGADLIDVGGESGVTDLPAVTAQEELERVLPIVERLAAEDAIVSIDTWKPEVARGALEAGQSQQRQQRSRHQGIWRTSPRRQRGWKIGLVVVPGACRRHPVSHDEQFDLRHRHGALPGHARFQPGHYRQ